MENNTSLYFLGVPEFGYIAKDQSNLPGWCETKIKNTQTIKKIVAGVGKNFLVWKNPNKLEFYEKDKEIKKYKLPNNEQIKDIDATYQTYQILTQSGKVWSLASMNQYMEVPILDADKSTFEEIRPVTFFTEKNLFVNEFIMGSCSAYYICNGDKLYVTGSNAEGRLGTGNSTTKNEPMPIFLRDKVTKIFGGIWAMNFFFITSEPDHLYAVGHNSSGELGIGNRVHQSTPQIVEKFKGTDVMNVRSCNNHTTLITTDGKTYSCGAANNNGQDSQQVFFTLIPQLKDKKAVQLATGSHKTLVLTEDNELYGWALSSEKPKNLNTQESYHPIKIKLPNFFTKYLHTKNKIKISCGIYCSFIYLDSSNIIIEDFTNLFESKKFCDSKIGSIGNEIEIHKSLVECRTKLKITQIKKFFEDKNKEQTLNFLKWVYCDVISNEKLLEQTFNSLQLTYPPENKLQTDLLHLYKDEESKDYSILVQEDSEFENNQEEEEEEEEFFEEIPVHKLVLIARSGLFREMFTNISENTNKVKDYSGKTIESLEILIKYFYTDKIELTADDDPELIIEELSDAVEYYQLNANSNLNYELKKIKNNFNLN
ncbi:btk-binding protein-related [Anaeramoeba flamelloides]|uniref:Btk-binding protein-related n=1 Tax=Anaeramoeba flamelloides TaxID=1746091 RepID=A0ABQ8YBI9_9EUKA|nr:btk-binding protein-related [Anaeramoeba flamelloides]